KLFNESAPPEQVTISFTGNGWELIEFGSNGSSSKLELAAASIICLQTARGLVGLHPLTGDVLWTRNDPVNGPTVLGGSEHIYVLRTNGGNSWAIRARDGVAVEVPRFPNSYGLRQHVAGSRVLVWNTAAVEPQLLLCDARSGENVWAKKFPAGS